MASAPHLRATSRILVMFKYDSRAGAGPSKYASSALETCSAPRSTSEKTATVAMPISRQARMTRTAISPRLAMRTLVNIAETLIVTIDSDAGLRAATPASAQQKAPPAGGALRIRVDYFDFGWSSTMPPLVFFEASSAFFLRAAMALSLQSLAVFTYSARACASSQVMSLALRR